MGEIEQNKCTMCGIVAIVQREYYHYDIKCECHSPNHFEIVWYCKNCTPEEPKTTRIHIKTSELTKTT